MTDLNPHDSQVRVARQNVRRARQNVIDNARTLRDQMDRLISGLEDSDRFIVNSLGEVQGRGPEVDRWCALLEERREVLAQLMVDQEQFEEDQP